MSTTKIVIISLLLVMAIFFVGLSLNLIEKPNQGVENSSSTEKRKVASEYSKDSWLKAVDSILAPFATSISITPEEVSISCPHTKQGFYLSEHTPTCNITVLGFSDTFKKLSLKPDSRAINLAIDYQPVDKKKEEISWPSKDSDGDKINFVILGNEDLKGQPVATISISIECTNCINQRKVEITFE